MWLLEQNSAFALFLAEGTHGVYPAGATGRQETREQGSNDQDGNHDREGQGSEGLHSVYHVLQ